MASENDLARLRKEYETDRGRPRTRGTRIGEVALNERRSWSLKYFCYCVTSDNVDFDQISEISNKKRRKVP